MIVLEKIKLEIYNQFKKFESLHYIIVDFNFYKLKINIKIEFYEDEYILETLNNPNIIKDTIDSIKNHIMFNFNINVRIKLANKKRINFDKDDIDEVVFINELPKFEYSKEVIK